MANNPENTYPLAVLWTWENRFKSLGIVADTDRQLDDVDERIAKKLAELEALKAEHAQIGRDRTEHLTNADTFADMVGGWCSRHEMPLPPKPVEPKPEPASLRPDPDRMHNAGIWDATKCECGARILRNKLTKDPWAHPDNGSRLCHPEDEDSPVATPKAKPTAEPAPEQTTSDADAPATVPATHEEVKTDA